MITNCLPQPLPRLRWLQLPRHARADAQAEEDWGAKEDGDDHDETHFTFRVAVFAAAAT